MNSNVILQTDIPDLKLVKRGKVRDIYDIGEHYLIISTDRLSAFDVIMNQGIPNKGRILTKISTFWFGLTSDLIQNHIVSTDISDYPAICLNYRDQIEGRSMLVKKAEVIPVECIVRGYISGSGWADYKKTGKTSGLELPEGLRESQQLPEPLFTPSTKADIGLHDENISYEQALTIADKDVIDKMKNASLAVYKKAAEYALSKGIIIADTKMEFGLYKNEVILVDELLTPDSSRFWPVEKYSVGSAQQSYDKQFVRDYLISINFNRQPPPPELPEEIINKTSEKYIEVLYKLTGESL